VKVTILFLLSACLSLSLTHAQQIFPVLSDNPIWQTVESTLFQPPVTTNRWTMLNDSSICGDDYQYAQPDIFYNFFFIRSKEIFTRVDSQKVYYRFNSNCNFPERLIYDFSLAVGDTFYLETDLTDFNINFDTTTFVVDSITFELHANLNRRVLHLSNSFTFPSLQWIEGIGNKEHPFYPLFSHGTEEEFYTLCYDSSGVQLYVGDRYQSCSVMISVNDPIEEQVDLYPNPSVSGWQIESAQHAMEAITVHDLQGKLVYRSLVGGFQSHVPPLPTQGIYLLEIEYQDFLLRKKLIQE